MTTSPIPVVHAVTSDEIVGRPDFIDVACGVMRALGPRGALHLRAGRTIGRRLEQLGEALAAAQRITGAWLVLNDRVDLAMALGARGAQLTSRSLRVDDARHVAPALRLGASVHGLEDATQAVSAGADWVVAGRAFEPATAARPDSGMEFVERLVTATPVPVIIIGGVLPRHCRALRLAGVHGTAVIRGIWDAPNAERAASEYLSCHDDAGVA